MVEKLGLDSSKYIDLKLGEKNYAMKKPGVRKMLELEDKCITINGEVDVEKYISEICKLISPTITIESLMSIPEVITLKGQDGFEIVLNGLTASKALKIASNTIKVEFDEDRNPIQKSNNIEMLESMLEYSSEKIDIDDIPTILDAKLLMASFHDQVNLEDVMGLFHFFHENFQAKQS